MTLNEPTTAKGRATRRALLAAAEEVFGEHTYERASVSEITRRAGVAQGTFYVYFPDKRAAFAELVRQLNHDMRRRISESVAGLDDRFEIERVGFRTYFEYVSAHKALYRVVREAEFVAPEIHRWHYDTLAEGYVAGLRRAQEAGQINDTVSPEIAAWILMGIGEFLGDRWVLIEGQLPSDDQFDEAMSFITAALAPAPALAGPEGTT
jgi:AcrR family transcriptional regulator